MSETRYGELPDGFWLYEPVSGAGAAPQASVPLPIVIVIPGWGDQSPFQLRAWIDHLVRRGAVVIFPNWQYGTESIPTTSGPPTPELDNLHTAIRAGIAELAVGTHPPVDLGRVAVVGQSYGGTLALYYAATAAEAGLPVPSAVLDAAGGCAHCPDQDLEPLRSVPAETMVLIVASEDDEYPDLVGDDPARMFLMLERVPLNQRDFVTIRSDDHGRPALRAGHNLATTAVFDGLNALDWYGPWKLTDALMDCAFDGKWCEFALGNTPEQRFMGLWSDGVPVTEAIVTDEPVTSKP